MVKSMNTGSKVEALPQPKGRLIHNPDVCTACGICELTCSLIHHGVYSRELALLKLHRNYYRGQWDGSGRFQVDLCLQCAWPACLYACPVGAIYIDERTKARVIDEDSCTGCRLCQEACPYNVIIYNPDTNLCSKCDLCGGDPECVKQCPASGNGALQYVQE